MVVVKYGDESLSTISSNPWIRRLVLSFVTVLSIGAVTAPSEPAQARVFVGVGIGAPVGWGYYAPPPYYGYHGYPYRAHYGYPGFFVGRGFGPYYGWHHWRHHYWR
jgi:hypothetical protein